MNFYEEALSLKDELLENRRHIHTNAEVGVHLPQTCAFVETKLKEYGIAPEKCGEGITALIGNGGKVMLLRADMDALPMKEESGLPFASSNPDAAHCCGHDMHTAMLLTAAKLLKAHESELQGTVKLMFQPGEETLQGSINMLEAGILESPKVDAALAYHVGPGKIPVGMFMYNMNSTMMFASNEFKIKVKGHGGHGALPHTCVDPINVGSHIVVAIQEIIARELDPNDSGVITVGTFHSGTSHNIISDEAIIGGTIRGNKKSVQELLCKRVEAVAAGIASTYGAQVEVEIIPGALPLICNPELTRSIVDYMRELAIPGAMEYPGITASASEDFSFVADTVPSTFMYLSAGFLDERGNGTAHNPKVQFNEDCLPIGAAYLAYCAKRWLEDNK